MIVYGDPALRVRPADFARALRDRARTAAMLDDYRTLLIGVGQLEQAIVDVPETPFALATLCRRATDCAAAAFCAAFTSGDDCVAQSHLRNAEALLRDVAAIATNPMTVKIPEGFAFYALYPEQYIVSAQKWARRTEGPSRALVIGVRSIGTTLSAVVAETLRSLGWATQRLTVRPAGEPFRRTLQISSEQVGDAAHALIVDEGPGLSGSSMAAVAEALVGNGLAPRRITFFPGHEHGPSGAVTPAVERWWREAPQCVTSLDQVRWNGRSLTASLCHATERLFGDEVIDCADASAGAWRRFAFNDEAAWPPAFHRFERTKYLMSLADGRRLLWKFAGLAGARPDTHALVATDRPQPEVERCITRVTSTASFAGFDATLWYEGSRLNRENIDSKFARCLANYVRFVAVAPDSFFDHVSATQRIAGLLYQNTRESLGEAAAGHARALADEAVAAVDPPTLLYGDGRLAPCEFIRGQDGQLYKTDSEGHDADHTMVGKQSILWDVAGAIIEWQPGRRQRAEFLSTLRNAGVTASANVLRFYCASYAAFRLGMAAMCELTAADAERSRLNQGAAFYRQQLAVCISPPVRADGFNPLAA